MPEDDDGVGVGVGVGGGGGGNDGKGGGDRIGKEDLSLSDPRPGEADPGVGQSLHDRAQVAAAAIANDHALFAVLARDEGGVGVNAVAVNVAAVAVLVSVCVEVLPSPKDLLYGHPGRERLHLNRVVVAAAAAVVKVAPSSVPDKERQDPAYEDDPGPEESAPLQGDHAAAAAPTAAAGDGFTGMEEEERGEQEQHQKSHLDLRYKTVFYVHDHAYSLAFMHSWYAQKKKAEMHPFLRSPRG